ncbi:molybdopterin-dependent oxidoreductase [Fundidesulfovibrio terrae]|uniref:molybdopterin-dependent oxidoreductase n=1 Tax=Fundidesulfovibrio terrae TaxID=2922866 RepID=UPI001FAEFB9C|nr:molybdopterin-dependent oxidoreductase [Fundidesulfovibrio terrae]
MVSISVNGRAYEVDADPGMPLLWVLRDVLGLTGTKYGCGAGLCWACTVLLGGKARPSCSLKLGAVGGQEIVTIEGVAPDHPVKQAWIQEQVPQCGYCQPGQIMRAVALLSENRDPSDEDIARAMQRNLCRCGTYGRIKAAVRRAARAMAGHPQHAAVPAGGFSQPSATAQGRSFAMNPFVSIGEDGQVTVLAKHVEAGQGSHTGLATLVAEELEADWSRVRAVSAPADERIYNNLFLGPLQATGGSTCIANSHEQYRQAGASARARLAHAAAEVWGVPVGEIVVENGLVRHASGDRQAGFGELAEAAAGRPEPTHAPLKDPAGFRLIGKQDRRLDVESKVQGAALYAMDVRLPGMLTAVVARPARFGARVKGFDPAPALAVAGVKHVVEIPQGVAVAGVDTWAARRGRDALRVEWDESGAETRGTAELLEHYKALAASPGLSARADGNVEEALALSGKTVEAVFEFPYLAHAPMETLNCVVRLADGACEIWAGDQFQTVDQANAASAAGLERRQVRINTLYAGGSFGRRANPASDYIVEAVHVARALGGAAPVHLVWTREDDIAGGRYRPMFVHALRAGIDGRGNLIAWRQRVAGQSILTGTPFESMMVKDGIDAVSVEGAHDMPYAIPNLSVELHTVVVGVPVLWWRSVGHSHSAYAVEVFLDEVAQAAGRDPVELRRALLADHPRHLGVLDLAAEKAGWGSALPAGRGRGVAVHKSFDTYVAQVAEVAVGQDGAFRVERVVCAVDCGMPVNPDIIRAQMQGGIAFGLSAALGEAVTLDSGRVEQSNFNEYRAMRFDRMPEVEVHIVPSAQKPTGVGEPGVPPIAPAVANALSAATGRRFRRLPLLETR